MCYAKALQKPQLELLKSNDMILDYIKFVKDQLHEC
jgi:hypothetical protein